MLRTANREAHDLLAHVRRTFSHRPDVAIRFAAIINQCERKEIEKNAAYRAVDDLFIGYPPLIGAFNRCIGGFNLPVTEPFVNPLGLPAHGGEPFVLEVPSTNLNQDQPTQIDDDWTQRTESTLIQTPTTTASNNIQTADQLAHAMDVQMNMVSTESIRSHNEPDPRLTIAVSKPFQPGLSEPIPIMLRLFFHDYAISQSLGLPYLSIPIIDLVADYLFASAPLVGSREFKFQKYWLAENKARSKGWTGDSHHFQVSFPYQLQAPGVIGSNEEERYHDLTAVGERDESGQGRGEFINLGDLYPQRRLWSTFAHKSRDEIRLDDYSYMSRSMSEDELKGSLSESLDEWNRRRPIREAHWCFVLSPLMNWELTDLHTQLTLPASLDVVYDQRHPTTSSTTKTILYAPRINTPPPSSEDSSAIVDTPYTAISPPKCTYSFQLYLADKDRPQDQSVGSVRRVCYFGFGPDSSSDSNSAEFLEQDLSASHGPVIKLEYDSNESKWLISTVSYLVKTNEFALTDEQQQSKAFQILRSAPLDQVGQPDSATIFTCQYEPSTSDSKLAQIRWLVNGSIIYEAIDHASSMYPKFYLTSRLTVKLKHQPGPNPSHIQLDKFPKSFDEAAGALVSRLQPPTTQPVVGPTVNRFDFGFLPPVTGGGSGFRFALGPSSSSSSSSSPSGPFQLTPSATTASPTALHAPSTSAGTFTQANFPVLDFSASPTNPFSSNAGVTSGGLFQSTTQTTSTVTSSATSIPSFPLPSGSTAGEAGQVSTTTFTFGVTGTAAPPSHVSTSSVLPIIDVPTASTTSTASPP